MTKLKGTQVLEIEPEGEQDIPCCGQRRSVERTLKEAREWGRGEKWLVKERSDGARS